MTHGGRTRLFCFEQPATDDDGVNAGGSGRLSAGPAESAALALHEVATLYGVPHVVWRAHAPPLCARESPQCAGHAEPRAAWPHGGGSRSPAASRAAAIVRSLVRWPASHSLPAVRRM